MTAEQIKLNSLNINSAISIGPLSQEERWTHTCIVIDWAV